MKKLFSIILTSALIISSISVSVFAEEYTPEESYMTGSTTFSAEIETTAIPLSAENLRSAETEFNVSNPTFELPINNDSFVIGSACQYMQRSNGYQVFNFTETIEKEGDAKLYGPITLTPGQICQAQLDGPDNSSLQYALAIYELDSDYNVITPSLDVSPFGVSNIGHESVGTVNNSSETKMYTVSVVSLVGCSATDKFQLNITLGQGFSDTFECNDSAAQSTPLTVNEIESTQYYTVPASLNSPYDNDWYELNVNFDINSLIIVPQNNESITIEMFRVENGILTKQKSNGHSFPVKKGYNYLRITSSSHNSSFSELAYNLAICESANALVKTCSCLLKLNGGDMPVQTYSVGETRYAVTGGDTLKCYVYYYDVNGNLVNDVTDCITVDIFDKAWNSGAPSYHTSGVGYAGNGAAVATIDPCPSAYGQHGGVSGMCYDSSATLTITSYSFGQLENISIFVTSRIMK